MCIMCVVRLKIVLRFVLCMYDCYVQFFFRWHSYTLFDCSWKTDEKIGMSVNLYTKFSHKMTHIRTLSEKKTAATPLMSSYIFEWIFSTHSERQTESDRGWHTWIFHSDSNQTINNVMLDAHVYIKFGANLNFPHFLHGFTNGWLTQMHGYM